MNLLHTRYLEALLNGEDLHNVRDELDTRLHKWERDLENNYAEARALQMRLSLPTDHPIRVATLQYLESVLSAQKEMKGEKTSHDDE